MQIKAYFENIHEVIIKELAKAQQEILVAVAWFTDQELYQSICDRLKKGVSVSIVLVEDDINCGDYGLNFNYLKNLGASVNFIPTQGKQGTLMHHKFCIIDNNTVITGSYNWSKRARSNNENITVIKDDLTIAQQYLNVFNELHTGNTENRVLPTPEIIRRRMEMIRNLVLLEESEDIISHVHKLSPFAAELGITKIIDNLNCGNYQEALEDIQNYLNKMTSIVSTETTEVPRLQFELSILELRLESLGNEKSELERLLIIFNHRHDETLGDLITEVLKAQAELKRLEAEQAKKEAEQSHADDENLKEKAQQAEDTAAKAERDYEEYSQNHEILKAEEPLAKLNEEEERELKSLFRKASNICHPDKVPETQKDDAHIVFIELQKAYKNNELKTVKKLYKQIKEGNFKTTKSSTLSKTELLKTAIAKMNFQIDEITDELKTLNQSESIKRLRKAGQTEEDWKHFFNQEKSNLEFMLNSLKSAIQSLSE